MSTRLLSTCCTCTSRASRRLRCAQRSARWRTTARPLGTARSLERNSTAPSNGCRSRCVNHACCRATSARTPRAMSRSHRVSTTISTCVTTCWVCSRTSRRNSMPQTRWAGRPSATPRCSTTRRRPANCSIWARSTRCATVTTSLACSGRIGLSISRDERTFSMCCARGGAPPQLFLTGRIRRPSRSCGTRRRMRPIRPCCGGRCGGRFGGKATQGQGQGAARAAGTAR